MKIGEETERVKKSLVDTAIQLLGRAVTEKWLVQVDADKNNLRTCADSVGAYCRIGFYSYNRDHIQVEPISDNQKNLFVLHKPVIVDDWKDTIAIAQLYIPRDMEEVKHILITPTMIEVNSIVIHLRYNKF